MKTIPNLEPALVKICERYVSLHLAFSDAFSAYFSVQRVIWALEAAKASIPEAVTVALKLADRRYARTVTSNERYCALIHDCGHFDNPVFSKRASAMIKALGASFDDPTKDKWGTPSDPAVVARHLIDAARNAGLADDLCSDACELNWRTRGIIAYDRLKNAGQADDCLTADNYWLAASIA